MDHEIIKALELFLGHAFYKIVALGVFLWIANWFRGWISNKVSQYILKKSGIISFDKKITVEGHTGYVERIMSTHVRFKCYEENKIVYIPIKKLLTSSVVEIPVDLGDGIKEEILPKSKNKKK